MKRETLEMLDGRVFYSEDNWQTIFQVQEKGQAPRPIRSKGEADKIRYLVVAQGSAGA